MGNYYRSGYQLSRRREKWIDFVSLILIVVAMVAGIIFGLGIGHVGRSGLVDSLAVAVSPAA